MKDKIKKTVSMVMQGICPSCLNEPKMREKMKDGWCMDCQYNWLNKPFRYYVENDLPFEKLNT